MEGFFGRTLMSAWIETVIFRTMSLVTEKSHSHECVD